MSDFDGHVLRGPRIAPSNDPKTGAPRGGVDFDVKVLTEQGDAAHAPDFGFSPVFMNAWGPLNPTHPCVDQYRAAQLMGQENERTEHLVFAANTASISASPADGEPVTNGTVKIPFNGKQRVTNNVIEAVAAALDDESGYHINIYDNDDVAGYLEMLPGTLAFTNDSVEVSGIGTDFVSRLQEGSSLLIKEPIPDSHDFNHYTVEVAEIIDIENLTLTEPFVQIFDPPAEPEVLITSTVKVFRPLMGSSKVILTDKGNRDIIGISHMKIRRGDVKQVEENIVTLTAASGHIEMADPANGVVQILDHAYTRSALKPYDNDPPALSTDRKDKVLEVGYYLAAPRFWWTRNDAKKTRFGWDGQGRRWAPYKGGAVRNMGVLEKPTTQLSPRPKNLVVGDYLPGTQIPDSMSQVRLGTLPNAGSVPLGDDPEGSIGFRGVLVVPDSIVDETAFDYSSVDPSPVGVVGQRSGKIHWNPAAFPLYAGQTVWYAPDIFPENSDGLVGKVAGSDIEPLFICPIPSPTERPLLRIGNRRWLEVLFADTEAEMSDIEPDPGQVAVALSTGQVKLSAADISKADMGPVEAPNEDFDPLWSGAQLYYDGVAMCRIAQPLKSPIKVMGAISGTDGSVPVAVPVPGIGLSGVRIVEDRTGRAPDFSENISRRSGASGVRRSPRGLGDTFVFTPNRPITDLKVGKNDWYSDNDPGINQCFMKYGTDTGSSAIKINGFAAAIREGQPLYFQNADFTPATYAPDVRMCSRMDGPYSLRGDEVLRFVLGDSDTVQVWDAASLTETYSADPVTYTAQEVSESINEILADSEYKAGYVGNLLYLTHPSGEGSIEILPGIGGEKDLSGCAALGFNPFWRTKHPVDETVARSAMDMNWLPDDGTCIGFKRTPFDKGGTKGVPDFRSVNRIEEMYLGDITASQHVYLQQSPLEDVAGIEEGVFLEVQDGPYRRALTHMDNVHCTFGEKRFQWLEDKAVSFKSKTPVSTINFGVPGVIPESLHPVLGGCFKAREPGGEPGYRWYTEGEEYVFVNGGMSGTAILTKEIGARLARGSKGTFHEWPELGRAIFLDDSAGFNELGLSAGDRLKVLTGDSKGSYIIKDWSPTTLTVHPPFPAETEEPVSWEIYELSHRDEIDEQLVADYIYKRFNHLPSETFLVNILTPIGVVSGDWATIPPVVQASRDLARGREVHVRMGLHIYSEDTPYTVRWLKKYEMGELANNSLHLTDGAWCEHTDHLSDDGAFQLRVATLEIQWADITAVADDESFSDDPAIAEISEATGLLKFSQEILDTYGQATVVFEEKLFPSTLIPPKTVEVHPDTGMVMFSQDDIDLYKPVGGLEMTAYWVSRMVTEDQTDVFLNPLVGAFMFREPLDEWQIVEASYRTTDSAGVLLTDDNGEAPLVEEFLPLYIRAEECTRIDSTTYSFNPTERTIRKDIEPVIYVGPEMANQPGSPVKCSVDYDKNEINFEYEISDSKTPEESDKELTPVETFPGSGMLKPKGDPMSMWNLGGRKVTVTYGVLEAFGGESSYTVSAPPVWRPPFNIEGKMTAFDLLSDRTDDLFPGQLMRLGAFLFYIKAVDYDAESDTTSVTFFPESPSAGAGSRAPGNDVLSLITEWPVPRVVDPNDPVVISEVPSGETWPTTSTTPHGFLVPLGERLVFGKEDPTPVNVFFERTPQTRNEVIFYVNLMEHVGIGFILEIGGVPYTTTGLSLSDDGTRTTVSITPPLAKGIMYGEDEVLVSVRPVYPPGPTPYLGLGKPYLNNQETDVVLWGEQDDDGNMVPGRSLVPVQEYIADPQTGDITFQYPFQEYVGSGERLTFRRIMIRVLKPRIEGGVATLPAFELRYKHVVAPSEENGLLGNSLVGTFSYRAPDSFYYRSLGLLDFSGETAQNIVKAASAKSSSYGAGIGVGGQENWEQGRVSLKVEQDHLHDKDRAARAYLGYFNAVTVAFEQIDEAATGRIVGDRDGKFRFWVGKGMEWTPRGFENPVTGRLNPRYAYASAFQSILPDLGVASSEILFDEDDLIVNPFDCGVDGNEDLEGEFPDTEIRRWMESEQFRFIKNDIDDRVLVGYRAVNFKFWPFPDWDIKGRVRNMWETHWLSRLFPTKGSYFTTTYPGAGADPKNGDYGIYTFFKKHKKKWRSSFLDQIGTIENPVQGTIGGITSVDMRPRTPRARVYRYSHNGFPELDSILFAGGVNDDNSFTKRPRPAVIATPLELVDIPLKDGKPNIDAMATADPENGMPDLNTGSWEDHTPPWAVGHRLLFGKPDGAFIVPKYNKTVSFVGEDAYQDLLVGEIIKGCVVTFGYLDDGEIRGVTNPDMLVDISDGAEKIVLDKSDTMTILVGSGIIADMNPDDVGLSDLSTYTATLPSFSVGLDVNVTTGGKIRDITFPKWGDPMIGIHELLGQSGPKPNMRVEGEVHFHNKDITPSIIPALNGEPRNDSGDFTLPYMKASNTELVRLRDAMGAVYDILQTDGSVGLSTHGPVDWLAVYPDEVLAFCNPAASEGLRVYEDVTPVATNGSYDPGSGEGDLREGDILFVESERVGEAATLGLEGIHSVGSVEVREDPDTGMKYSVVGMPRFVSSSKVGEDIDYEIGNLVTVHGDYNSDTIYNLYGVRIDETVFVGGDPAEPWDDGFTRTRLEFEGVDAWVVDDGSSGDGVPYGSGFYNPLDGNPDHGTSSGGLNDLLAGAKVGTEINIRILARSVLAFDVDGNPMYEPSAPDGSVKVKLTVRKVEEGEDTTQLFGPGVPHKFEILINDVSMGETDMLWFYSDDTLPGQVMVVETYHPGDPAVTDPGDPDYAAENMAGWFPWELYQDDDGDPEQYVENIDPDPLMEDDGVTPSDPVELDHIWKEVWRWRRRYTSLTSVEEAYPDFGEGLALEEFHVDLEVKGGVCAHVDNNRLSFFAPVDPRLSLPRLVEDPEDPEALIPPTHSISGLPRHVTLNVSSVVAQVWDDSALDGDLPDWGAHEYVSVSTACNDKEHVNGGENFTFLRRHAWEQDRLGVTLDGVGYWENGVGELKVCGLEGHGNQPITFAAGQTMMASAVPSSDLRPVSGTVLDPVNSLGAMISFEGVDDASTPGSVFCQNRIGPVFDNHDTPDPVTPENSEAVSFDCSQVGPGDVVYVKSGYEGSASAKVGTHLVRYALASAGTENLTPLDPTGVTAQEAPIRPVSLMEETVSVGVSGPVDLTLPVIEGVELDIDTGEHRLHVSELSMDDEFPTSANTGWLEPLAPAVEYLYVLCGAVSTDLDEGVWTDQVIKVAYTAVEAEDGAGHFKLDLSDVTDTNGGALVDGDGLPLDAEAILAVLQSHAGKKITGARYFKVNVKHPDIVERDERLVGYNWNTLSHTNDDGETLHGCRDQAVYGFVNIGMTNIKMANWMEATDGVRFSANRVGVFWSDADVPAARIEPAENASGDASPTILVGKVEHASTLGEFQADINRPVYDNVPAYIDISNLNLTALNQKDGDGVLNCLLPSTVLSLTLWMEAGVFLEPSFPRPTFDLKRDKRALVGNESEFGGDADSLDEDEIGERQSIDYFIPPDPLAPDDGPVMHPYTEHVVFTVRRIRRFHDVLLGVSEAMSALRYAYETRKGAVDTYTPSTTFHKVTLQGSGTQLGPCDDEDVNVNAGDILRVLDPDTGELKGWAEIAKVESGTALKLNPPGFIGEPPEPNDPVEIWLRRAPVPHEQSNEELLELATEETLMTRRATLEDDDGEETGYPASGGIVIWNTEEAEDPAGIYEASVNWLTDTNAGLGDGQVNFMNAGVGPGDYLLIDPAEELVGPAGGQPEIIEYGMRPYGDLGCEPFQDGFKAGGPSETDDNRGYYKVLEVEQGRIKVSPSRGGSSDFIGASGAGPDLTNALHGGTPSFETKFALYPTVHGSELTGNAGPGEPPNGEEGQGDLRPTAFAGEDPLADDPYAGDTSENSFEGNPFSVGPFSYRIIRPTGLLRDDAVELILFHRERILSLMENFESAMNDDKLGSYWVFQNKRHLYDLGKPTIPDTGLGVPRNAFLYGLAGQYKYAPFLNDSDCLSILDRRVILEDEFLDLEHPPNDPPDPYYTAFTGGEAWGLPLLLGRIEDVLDKSDRIRPKRLAWLYLRTTRTDGTLVNIKNWKATLVERLKERQRLRMLQDSMGG